MGDTINTNAAWLGKTLGGQGIPVTKVHTIGDDVHQIRAALKEAMHDADLVITTGGLGPTHDDITKKTIADFLNAKLVIHQPTLTFIKKVFEERNIPFTESNYHQAEVLHGCEVLFNKQGTAPGMWIEENGSILVVLPGIPFEMKKLVQDEILPRLSDTTGKVERIFSRHIKIAGIGESTISDELLGPLDEYISDDISVAFLPSPQANTIRVDTKAESEQQADGKNKELIEYIYGKAGDFIIGEGENFSLSEAVGKVLRNHSLTISTAESCTGGMVANSITDVAGSSDYMLGGIIAYANAVKIEELDVCRADLENHGAVSKQVALQMAKGVAQKLNSTVGISTTGIAGPGGGSEEKPVGTVWIGYWSANAHFAIEAHFTNDRQLNKERSTAVALETVRRTILGVEPLPYGLKPHAV